MAAKYKKRKDGRYAVQIQIGIKEDGKPKYKTLYGKTQGEIEKKERDFRQGLDKGIIIDDEGLTLAQWSVRWMELYKTNVGYYTREMYKSVINVHIIPTLGDVKLKNLKTFHIQEMINAKAKKGLTRTLEKIKVTLGQIIKQAIINEYIYKDIMLGVQIPKKQKNEKRALSKDEIEIIKTSELTLFEKTFIFTLLYTGLRRSEILALSKKDLDLRNKTIDINKSIYFIGNKPELKPSTKSEAGTRMVPLPDFLVNLLSEYINLTDSFMLFPSKSGGIMTKSIFRRFWDNTIKKIENQTNKENLKIFNINNDITPHIFRHTYATILYNSGVDMKTAQELLGHSTIQVTMNIYTHLDNQKISIAKNKLDTFIESAN